MRKLAELILGIDESIENLSVDLDIDITRLNQIIGGADANLSELRKIAAYFSLPLSDFSDQTDIEKSAELLFRSSSQRHIAPSHQKAIRNFSSYISRSIELLNQADEKPEWLKSFNLTEETYDEAERFASLFRELFYGKDLFSPLLRLPSLLVNDLNVLLFVRNEKVEGASALISGYAFIFVSPRFPGRMLFTLAHELGHMVAHHGTRQPSGASFDSSINPFYKDRTIEGFANAFASCLLLPRDGMRVALNKIRKIVGAKQDALGDIEILYLSQIFGVSFQAAAQRCENLNLLPEGGARSLYEHICKNFGNPEKRAAALGLPARPEINFPSIPAQLLKSAIEKINSGEVSIGRASENLNLSISSLMGMHSEYVQ